jgi:hypothetical protein
MATGKKPRNRLNFTGSPNRFPSLGKNKKKTADATPVVRHCASHSLLIEHVFF